MYSKKSRIINNSKNKQRIQTVTYNGNCMSVFVHKQDIIKLYFEFTSIGRFLILFIINEIEI